MDINTKTNTNTKETNNSVTKPSSSYSSLLQCLIWWPLAIYLLTYVKSQQPLSDEEVKAIVYSVSAALAYTLVALVVLRQHFPDLINKKPMPLSLLYLAVLPFSLFLILIEQLSILIVVFSICFYLMTLLPNFRTSAEERN
ncbi:MAG: hypothetical protein MK214_15995 [Thalassotalea sp.]|nr:hypothetical protein [Thalassotalea sp.]